MSRARQRFACYLTIHPEPQHDVKDKDDAVVLMTEGKSKGCFLACEVSRCVVCGTRTGAGGSALVQSGRTRPFVSSHESQR